MRVASSFGADALMVVEAAAAVAQVVVADEEDAAACREAGCEVKVKISDVKRIKVIRSLSLVTSLLVCSVRVCPPSPTNKPKAESATHVSRWR